MQGICLEWKRNFGPTPWNILLTTVDWYVVGGDSKKEIDLNAVHVWWVSVKVSEVNRCVGCPSVG